MLENNFTAQTAHKTKGEVSLVGFRGGKFVPAVIGANGLVIEPARVDGGEQVSELMFPNTTLRLGRRLVAAALGGGLITDSFDCSVRTMDWGIGGVDGFGNKVPVSEKNTGFIGGSGNVIESTTVDASLASGDEPAVIFHGALGYSSASNGQKITQIGLKMQNGNYWAITTFGGFDKDVNTAFIINWKVYFL